jgi:hypothetical protein
MPADGTLAAYSPRHRHVTLAPRKRSLHQFSRLNSSKRRTIDVLQTLRYATDKERDFRNWLIGVLRPLPGVRPSHEVAYHASTKQDATPTPSKRFTRNSTRSTRLRQQGAISAAEPSTIRQPCSITFLAWTRRKPLRRRPSRTFRGFD